MMNENRLEQVKSDYSMQFNGFPGNRCPYVSYVHTNLCALHITHTHTQTHIMAYNL